MDLLKWAIAQYWKCLEECKRMQYFSSWVIFIGDTLHAESAKEVPDQIQEKINGNQDPQ